MQKIFIKAIINTLVGIFAAAVITWAVVTLAFPSSLVTPTANMGWTKVSAWYAASSYVRTKDLDDLALAVDMSINVVATKKAKIAQGENVTISEDDYKQVVKYCSILVRQEGFEEFCKERDESASTEASTSAGAKDYYYTSLTEAYYNTGYKRESLARALIALQESSNGLDGTNAMTLLVSQAVEAQDVEFCKLIRTDLMNADAEKTEKYNSLIASLTAVIGDSETFKEAENSSEESGEQTESTENTENTENTEGGEAS